jgi:hypothetical protein
MPVEAANAAIADRRLGKALSAALERLKPEAAYFTTIDGDRGVVPRVRFTGFKRHPIDLRTVFHQLHATVELSPVMTPQAVQAGLAKAAALSKL